MSANKAPTVSELNIPGKTHKILCDLSELEPDEVKDNSELVELGIDSLIGMELTREVSSVFKCTMGNSQLMGLTDFLSLVICIRTTLGLHSQDVGDVT